MRARLSSLVALSLFGCVADAEPNRASSKDAPSAVASASPVAVQPAASQAPPAPLSASAAPTEKVIEALVPDKSGLVGKTIDFPYDGSDVSDKGRAYEGRIFLHEKALRAVGPLPLVIFMHGLNRAFIPHRWMGGGNEGDVRKILSDLLDSNAIPPVIIAGPGSIAKEAVAGGASFPVFDHDKFVAQVIVELGATATVDESRVIVMGHSGAGCSDKGGVIAPTTAVHPPYAIISIDTCMAGPLATALGGAPPNTNVIVTWQTATWERNIDFFRKVFEKERQAHPAAEGVLRELDSLPNLPLSHDATVKQTFDKWLPRLLPPR